PPTISTISPSAGYQGTTPTATISGTNLSGATSVTFSGTGVTAAIAGGGTATSLPIVITIAPNATPGTRSFTVTTPIGSVTSSSLITSPVLQPGPPTIKWLTPGALSRGTTSSITFYGLNMLGASAITFSGLGVTGKMGPSTASNVPVIVTVA